MVLGGLMSGCGASAPERPRVSSGRLDLRQWDFQKHDTVRLDGAWEFHGGRLLSSDDLEAPKFPSGSYCNVPGRWCVDPDAPPWSIKSGTATYRLVLLKPAEMTRVSLRIPGVSSAYVLRVNGREFSNGVIAREQGGEQPSGAPKSLRLNVESDRLEILLQVSNFHDLSGGIWRGIEFGTERGIENLGRRLLVLDFLIVGSLVIMFLYHAVIFALRTRVFSAFYFSLFCLVLGIRTGIKGERFLYETFPDSLWFLVHKFEYLTFYLAAMSFAGYIHHLYPDEMKKAAFRFLQIAALLFSLATLILPAPHYQQGLVFFQVLTAALILYAIYVIGLAAIRRRDLILVFGLGCGAMLLGAAGDILFNNGLHIIEFDNLSSFGVLIFVASQAFLLAFKFSRTFQAVEKLTRNLEDRVGQRTRELLRSRDEIEELNGISRSINQSVDLDDVLEKCYQYFITHFRVDTILLFLPNAREHEIAYYRGKFSTRMSDEILRNLKELRFDLRESDTIHARVFHRRRRLYLSRIRTVGSGFEREMVDLLGLSSLLMIPLVVRGRCIGLMNIANYGGRMELGAGEIHAISRFCDQIAGAVQASMLLNEARESRLEVEKLNEFSRQLNETDNLEQVLDSIFAYFESKFKTRVMLQLADPARGIFYAVKGTAQGLTTEEYREILNMKVPLSREGGLAYLVYRRGKPFYTERIEGFPSEYDRRIAEIMRLESVFLVPLIVRNEVIGIMSIAGLTKAMRLAEREKQSIVGFCRQIAGAVHTSNLLREVREANDGVTRAKEEIEALNDLLNQINQVNDIKKVASIVTEFAGRRYGIRYSSIFAFDESGTHARFVSGDIPDWLTREQKEFIYSEPFPVTTVETGALMLANFRRKPTYYARVDRSRSTPQEQYIVDAYGLKSFFVIPLLIHGEIIGFLNFMATAGTERLSKEVRTRLSILAEQIAAVIYSKNLFEEIQSAREKSDRLLGSITRDLQTARKIQQSLVPGTMPGLEAYEVDALYLPMEQVGGDLFDFVPFPNGRFGVFVADVSGHGIPAAMVASMAKLALTVFANHVSSPGEFISYMNSSLTGRTADHFLTCFYGIFDPVTKELTYANAGHPPFLLLRDGEISSHGAKGPPVGIVEEMSFADNVIEVREGDRFLFFTDGIEEATNKEYEEFGVERIHRALLEDPRAPISTWLTSVLMAAMEFAGARDFQDDVTMVGLRVK